MDIYLHDKDAVDNVILNLENDIKAYRASITALTNLINSIDSSSAWVDKTIKTSFVTTASSYVRQYENLIKEMEILVKYLSSKNSSSSGLEHAYAGG
jgi:hypothetical protein